MLCFFTTTLLEMLLSCFAVSALTTTMILASFGSAQAPSGAGLYSLIAADSMYESNCPSDADHMNGCFHFNVTARPRTNAQLVSELTYVMSDTLLVDPHYVGQTADTNARCAVLNRIHSRTYSRSVA